MRIATLWNMHRIFTTSFASVYPLYVTKVEQKGHAKADGKDLAEVAVGDAR